jgi:hypothetical protein
MSEWWTYRPSDFLMFAPRTYWRLFELHNEAWWPAQLLGLLAAATCTLWFVRRRSHALRLGAALLAAACAFVAGPFLLTRYAPINWAATGFAIGYGALALGLALLATRRNLVAVPAGASWSVGLVMWAWAVVGHPLLALADGRPWTQAEVFGLAPDPTAIATLGGLLLVSSEHRVTVWMLRVAWMLALAWCAISAATLLTMGAWQGWVVLAAALGAIAAALAATVSHRRAVGGARRQSTG